MIITLDEHDRIVELDHPINILSPKVVGPIGAANQVLTVDPTGSFLIWAAGGVGSVTGSGVAAQVAYWSSGTVLAGDTDLTFDGTTLTVTALSVGATFATTDTTPVFGSFTLTVAATGSVVVGTGAGTRIAYWDGTNSITSSANLWTDGTKLVLAGLDVAGAFTTTDTTPIFGSFTLTVAATGTVPVGTGTDTYVAFWTGANTLSSDAGMSYIAAQDALILAGYIVANGVGETSSFADVEVAGSLDVTASYSVDSVQVVTNRQTGYAAMTGTANRATTYDTSTITLAQLAGRVMALQADLTTHGLIGA